MHPRKTVIAIESAPGDAQQMSNIANSNAFKEIDMAMKCVPQHQQCSTMTNNINDNKETDGVQEVMKLKK